MTASPAVPVQTGLDLDDGVRPQDDLFRHVNGRWLASTRIPDDRASYGAFTELNDRSEADVRAILEEAVASGATVGTTQRMVGDLYASFMDTETLDRLGTQPLAPLLSRVHEVADARGLLALTGELQREGAPGVVEAQVWVDRGDPSRYVLHVGQGGLGLPDESYYREEGRAEIRDAYVRHIAAMLDLTGSLPPGETDSGDVAARVMALETRLAASHWDTVACRDAVRTYNLLPRAAVERLLPGWDAWLDGHQVPEAARGEVVVAQPDAIEGAAAALREVPVADWRAWLTWHVVRATAAYLPAEVSRANFSFYGTTLMGALEQRDRWKRGVGVVEDLLGEAVGELYVARHYPHEAHDRMTALVSALVEAYRERLSTLDWMSPETRERALAKLATFTPKIGKPVRWRDYSGLHVDPADLLGNVRRGNAHEIDRWLRRVGGPVDRDEWFMTPQTVNAYYNPAMNEIVFPAAILQPPMFDPEADDAFNYGAIGAVIGHEIGHGFDDQGSRYDGDGSLRNWWSDGDRERFEARTAVLARQYDGLAPSEAPDARVNGALTLGENIGDLGGVEVALHAYRLATGRGPAAAGEDRGSSDGTETGGREVESSSDGGGHDTGSGDGMTPEQRFFLGWARIWRTLTREEEVRRRLTIDPHSPPEHRSNVVRNVDAFHEAFGTSPGDGLWLDPEERVRIW